MSLFRRFYHAVGRGVTVLVIFVTGGVSALWFTSNYPFAGFVVVKEYIPSQTIARPVMTIFGPSSVTHTMHTPEHWRIRVINLRLGYATIYLTEDRADEINLNDWFWFRRGDRLAPPVSRRTFEFIIPEDNERPLEQRTSYDPPSHET